MISPHGIINEHEGLPRTGGGGWFFEGRRPARIPSLGTSQMAEFSPSRGSVKKVKSEASGSATLGTHRRPSVPGGLDIPDHEWREGPPRDPSQCRPEARAGFPAVARAPRADASPGTALAEWMAGEAAFPKSTEAARCPGTPPQPRPWSPAGAPPPPLRRALPGYREGQSLAKGHRCPRPGLCPPVPRDS